MSGSAGFLRHRFKTGMAGGNAGEAGRPGVTSLLHEAGSADTVAGAAYVSLPSARERAMRKRPQKARRTGKGRSSRPAVVASEIKALLPATRPARRPSRHPSTTDTGQFLSPEQQHLLRVRRDAERRQAKRQQVYVGGALVATVGVATVIAWLTGWI